MFRKLVENISFSPALVESLSRYAKRLKREARLRRLGLIILSIVFAVQITTVLYPSEQSNMASQQDFVYGGFSSLNNLIEQYDKNTSNIRAIATELGITKLDIVNSSEGYYSGGNNIYTVGHHPLLGLSEGDLSFSYTTLNSDTNSYIAKTAYLSAARAQGIDSDTKRSAFIGNSGNIGWFAIDKHSGSIILNGVPDTIDPNKYCPVKPSGDSEACADIFSHSAWNESQNAKASKVYAAHDDIIKFTLLASNSGDSDVTSEFTYFIKDLQEYARITDISDGGILSKDRTTIEWSDITLKPGEKVNHSVTAKILSDIPATSHGFSDSTSYDCIATTVLSNRLDIPVDCPKPKIIESLTSKLPKINAPILLSEAIVMITVIFLYARSRQLKEEVRLIRRDINSGSID